MQLKQNMDLEKVFIPFNRWPEGPMTHALKLTTPVQNLEFDSYFWALLLIRGRGGKVWTGFGALCPHM